MKYGIWPSATKVGGGALFGFAASDPIHQGQPQPARQEL